MDRRLAARHAHDLDVELHQREKRVRLRASDVSRHGLFVACEDPPPLGHALMVTVRLRGGPFVIMANVVRRVTLRREGALGMGMKLFCMGADAKHRWDRFVWSIEHPALEFPTRATSKAAACFLVQPQDAADLVALFHDNIEHRRVLHLSPAVRKLGAEIQVVLVHPDTHEELAFTARVVELNPDHPLRMGVRFDDVTGVKRKEFMRLVGKPSSEGAPVVQGEQRPWTEYAFFSPKLRAEVAAEAKPGGEPLLLEEVAAEELAVIEGQLLDHPALDLIDKRELFDFAWVNDDVTDE